MSCMYAASHRIHVQTVGSCATGTASESLSDITDHSLAHTPQRVCVLPHMILGPVDLLTEPTHNKLHITRHMSNNKPSQTKGGTHCVGLAPGRESERFIKIIFYRQTTRRWEHQIIRYVNIYIYIYIYIYGVNWDTEWERGTVRRPPRR